MHINCLIHCFTVYGITISKCFDEALSHRTQTLNIPTAVLTQAFSGFNMPTCQTYSSIVLAQYETLNKNFVSCISQFRCLEKSINCTSWSLWANDSVITVPVLEHTDQYKTEHNRWVRVQMFWDSNPASDFYTLFRLQKLYCTASVRIIRNFRRSMEMSLNSSYIIRINKMPIKLCLSFKTSILIWSVNSNLISGLICH
jgi:hypothetical protein